MTPAAPLAVAAAAAAVLAYPARRARDRLPESRLPRADPAPRDRVPLGPRAASAVAALGAWFLAGPRLGPLAAVAVAVATTRLFAALPARAAAERDRACATAVPLVADMVAACLAAGATPDAAIDATCAAISGPLADELVAAARATRLGVPAREAWTSLSAAGRPPPVRALARTLARAAGSGAPPAALLRTVADDARAAARHDGEVAARRAAVAAVLPLGLCFLPAFVLLGIVPLVAGLVRALVV